MGIWISPSAPQAAFNTVVPRRPAPRPEPRSPQPLRRPSRGRRRPAASAARRGRPRFPRRRAGTAATCASIPPPRAGWPPPWPATSPSSCSCSCSPGSACSCTTRSASSRRSAAAWRRPAAAWGPRSRRPPTASAGCRSWAASSPSSCGRRGAARAARSSPPGRRARSACTSWRGRSGWLTFVVPGVLLLILYVPGRAAQVRRLTAGARALRAPAASPRLLAMRAAFSLPYPVLLRHTPDPFGDLERGEYDRLAAAAREEAGLAGARRPLASRGCPSPWPGWASSSSATRRSATRARRPRCSSWGSGRSSSGGRTASARRWPSAASTSSATTTATRALDAPARRAAADHDAAAAPRSPRRRLRPRPTWPRDGAGLLDALGLDRAHVVGASMGGMIAQLIAARYPERVLSLASIMSNTGHRWRGMPGLRIYPMFLRRPGARPRRSGRRRRRGVPPHRVAGLPVRGGGAARHRRAQLGPRPRPGGHRAPARGHPHHGRSQRRAAPDHAPRRSSSTAPRTAWSRRPAGGRRRGRSPGASSSGSRGWATTSRATRGRGSSTRSCATPRAPARRARPA